MKQKQKKKSRKECRRRLIYLELRALSMGFTLRQSERWLKDLLRQQSFFFKEIDTGFSRTREAGGDGL